MSFQHMRDIERCKGFHNNDNKVYTTQIATPRSTSLRPAVRHTGAGWVKNVFCNAMEVCIFSGTAHDSCIHGSLADLVNWLSLCYSLPPGVTFQKQGSCVWLEVTELRGWQAHKLLLILIKHLRHVSYFYRLSIHCRVNTFRGKISLLLIK